MTNTTKKAKANKELAKYTKGYLDRIPLGTILSICEQLVGMPVQEDGTRWEGMLCGEDGTTSIQIEGMNARLHIDWHKMQSGRFELNVYIS